MGKAREVSKKPKHIWLVAFGILLLLVGFGYKALVWYQLRADKQRFTEASVLVDKIYADIVTELGQPEDSKRTNSCSVRYQEFTGSGDLTCHIDGSATYLVRDKQEAEAVITNVQDLISHNGKLKSLDTLNTDFHDSVAGSTVYHIVSNKYSVNSMQCSIGYIYDPPGGARMSGSENKKLEIGVSCSDAAKSQIYSSIQ